jgi:hypothetical protein
VSSGVDEDASHGLGGRGEEVAAIVPLPGRIGTDQPKVGFVDEGGWLESVAGGLGRHSNGGQGAKLGIHEREESLGGAGVTAFNGSQDVIKLAHLLEHTLRGHQ